MDNTMADDFTTVFVDRDCQTLESGGLTCNTESQTEQVFANYNHNIYTENIVSVTTKHVENYEYINCYQDTEVIEIEVFNSSTQTLITCTD